MNATAHKTPDHGTLPNRNPNYAEPVEVREPWASAFKKAGMVSLKDATTPSIQALARETGIHGSTIARLIQGEGRPRARTIEAVAKALEVDFLTVTEWISGKRAEFHEEWLPPVEAKSMTPRQRKMVESLIRELVRK